MANTVHPFERAGLGLAPFRCIGMFKKIHEVPGTAGMPGGSCDYCGTGILYCFSIKSSDGRQFVVGSDCVAKTDREYGNADLDKQVRAELKKAQRETRQAKATVKRAARELSWKEQRQAAFPGWAAANADAIDLIRANAESNVFLKDLSAKMDAFRQLTPAQLEAAVLSIAYGEIRAESKRIEKLSQHIGTVGERIEMVLTCRKIIQTKVPAFRGDWASYLWLCDDANGNRVCYFGSAFGSMPEEGETATVKAAVKAHGERDGVAQTIIQRPKLIG